MLALLLALLTAHADPTPTEPSEPAATAPVAPTAPAKGKAKAAAQAVAKALTPYGFLKPTVSVASSAVESFGRPNQSAITAAANPVVAANPDATEYSFQVAQSRVGLKINDGKPVRGTIELDFIDFDKSTPTVASVPRVRVAQVEWDPAKGHTIMAGQGWDLFSPLMPHHFNLVGANFQAGNAGFMRQQIQYRYHPDHLEVGVAVGMPGVNIGPSEGTLEQGPMPSFAARVGYVSDHVRVSAHGFTTLLRPTPDDDLLVWAAALNAEVQLDDGFNLRAEGYVSQNTANTGMLTLAQGRAGTDVRDAGGWLSIKKPFGDHVAPYLTVGGAAVLNPDDVALAYTPATDTTPAARNPSAGPGIRWNLAGRLGVEVPVIQGLSFVGDGFVYVTRHQLADAAVDATREAGGFEGGMMYRF